MVRLLVVCLCLFSFQSFTFANEITIFEHPEIAKQREALLTLKTSLEYHLIAEALETTSQFHTKELYTVLRERIERLPDVSRILDVPILI